jgi:hypothetical protein
MLRYSASASVAVNTSAATRNAALGLVTGSTKTLQLYEAILGCNAAVVDAQVLAELSGSSTSITTGTGITPAKLDSGNPASTLTVSSQPTGFTANTQPYVGIAFNTRATVRWAAVDPDSRIVVPAGGGTTGNLVVFNSQPGTVTGITIDHQVSWAE